MRANAQVGEGNLERRAIKAEKTAMRAMLYPVMQAEEDRRRAAHCVEGYCSCAKRCLVLPGGLPASSCL